jgi:transposase-like protein
MTVATVEIAVALTADEARALTEQIQAIQDTLRTGHELLVEAYEGRAWLALGYVTWDAYCKSELPELHMLRLDREQRQELVAGMREAGMSTRAIASGLGVSKNTVTKDVSQMGTPAPPTVGTDGKTYTPPVAAPRKRRRRPLPDAWFDASLELTKAVERLDRLSRDDRAKSNTLHPWEARRAARLLAEIIERLDGGAR